MLRLALLTSGLLGRRVASAVAAGSSRWPKPCLCEPTSACRGTEGLLERPVAGPMGAAGHDPRRICPLCPEAPSARHCYSSSSGSSNIETNEPPSAGVGAAPPRDDQAQGQQGEQERGQQQRQEQDRQMDRQVQAAAEPQAESGQACESRNAAARDVLLSRVAALEAEVAALREAVGPWGKEGGGRGSGGDASADRGMRGDPHGTSLTGRPEGEEADGAGGGGETAREEQKGAGAGGDGSGQGGGGGGGFSSGAKVKETGGEWREESWFGDGEERREGGATEAAAESLAKLHPKITWLVQSGYLESLHHLRQRIMVDEWEGGGRQRALRRAVADLEAQLAERAGGGQAGQADGVQGGGDEEGRQGAGDAKKGRQGAGDAKKGQQGAMALSWEELSELYKDPTNLSIIRDPRVRSTARAVLQRVLDERHEAARKAATDLAKELADQVTKGPADLLSGLWGLLPLPAFLKGK